MKLKQSFRNDEIFQVVNRWILPLCLVLSVCAGCKQSDTKVIAYNVPDFSQMSFADVEDAANKGNPRAQEEMGHRFHTGKGVPKDSTLAAEWWQRAAKQGFPPAEYELGLAYGSGDGVPKDEREGLRWWRLASNAGWPRAQQALGLLYCRGGVVPQDYSQAFRLFESAAEQGYPTAQYLLALCYRDGKGNQTNETQYFMWLQRSASNGLANAQAALGKHYIDTAFQEIGIPKRRDWYSPLTREERNNPNFTRAVEWFRRAANQNDWLGQIYLGTAYATGMGAEHDPVEASKWLALASTKEPDLVASLIAGWRTNKIILTPEQFSEGKLRAQEFSKTNHIVPTTIPEIPSL